MARILLENIKQEAKELNWQVLSEEYINLKTPIKLECPEGHSIMITYERWRKAHTCPICELSKKETQSNDMIVPKNNGDYRILALDQSTQVTGWAIFQNGELIRHGMYSVQGQEASRINDVRIWLWNMITVWKIDYVQLEDIQLQDHNEEGIYGRDIGVNVYKVLSHLQGVLENLLFVNKIDYSMVFPATWRSVNEIKGRSKADKKKNAQIKVKTLYNISVPVDEAEAICIGLYACKNHSKNTSMVSWD